MACTDKRWEQIAEFASGRLSGPEADDLLDHILVCSDCSNDFDLVTDLVTSVDRHGEELSQIQDVSVVSETVARVRQGWDAIRRGWNKRPVVVRVLVPAAVALALAFVLFYPSSDDGVQYSQLARFEAPPYILRSLRGPVLDESVKTLFEEGMTAYTERDFPKTIEKLSELVKTHPEFGEASFYLGISYLLNDQYKRATDVLQKAAALSEGYPLEEQSHWYSGMAYLKREDKKNAMKEFQRVVEFNGPYRMNAEKMIGKIERMRGDERR